MTPKGWWRRNLVSLVSIVPLLALAVGLGYIDSFYRFWNKGALVAVGTNAEGFSTLEGVQMRLVELTTTVPKDSSGKAVVLPSGVTAWKAVIEYKLTEPDAAAVCKLELEDDKGRLYGNGPAELSRAKGVSAIANCGPEDKGSTHYRVAAYFVLPGDAKPAAVRVSWVMRYPYYARLPFRG